MTQGSISKKIIFFAIPLFLGNLFQQLYNTADSLIVGNFLGSNALAAVSSSGKGRSLPPTAPAAESYRLAAAAFF